MLELENNFIKTIFKVNDDNVLTFNYDLTKNEITYVKCLILEHKQCELSDISVEKIITDKDYSDISITSSGDMILNNLLENNKLTKITSFDFILDYYNTIGLQDINELIYFS